jgi:hypothetical protein
MKKIGILLAILLVAGVCAMADETGTVQDDILFADVDAVALSQVEMEAVDGGRPGRSNMTIDGDGPGYSNTVQASLNSNNGYYNDYYGDNADRKRNLRTGVARVRDPIGWFMDWFAGE